MKDEITARAARLSLITFVVFECLYALLRSGDMLAVDGAHRCLEVFRRQTLFFHGSNHMLYPVNVLLWGRFMAALGLKSTLPMQFFSHVELMNCTAAAASLALLCFLMYLGVPRWPIVIGATVGLALSKAFLEQATNANEPMVGVLWSLIAVALAMFSLRRGFKWAMVLSGLFFALAMATYQSTIFLAPAVVFGIVFAHRLYFGSETSRSNPLYDLARFASAGLVGCLAIFGSAYRHVGVHDPIDMWKRFTALSGGRVEVGISVGKVLNLPVGMMRNTFPFLHDYVGLHSLMASRMRFVLFFTALFLFVAFVVCCLISASKGLRSSPPLVRLGWFSAAVGLFFTLIPVELYDPNYDKLWLQPLACLACLIALSLDVIRRQRPGAFSIYRRIALVILLLVAANLVWTIRLHRTTTPGLAEAKSLADIVAPQDIVVGGWDNVSVLYAEIWASDSQFVDFMDDAIAYGADETRRLQEAILSTQRKGGRVYFLDLVDIPEQDWNAYLGSRCGVPFTDFDEYREQSHLRTKFQVGASEISLSEFDPNGGAK